MSVGFLSWCGSQAREAGGRRIATRPPGFPRTPRGGRVPAGCPPLALRAANLVRHRRASTGKVRSARYCSTSSRRQYVFRKPSISTMGTHHHVIAAGGGAGDAELAAKRFRIKQLGERHGHPSTSSEMSSSKSWSLLRGRLPDVSEEVVVVAVQRGSVGLDPPQVGLALPLRLAADDVVRGQVLEHPVRGRVRQAERGCDLGSRRRVPAEQKSSACRRAAGIESSPVLTVSRHASSSSTPIRRRPVSRRASAPTMRPGASLSGTSSISRR